MGIGQPRWCENCKFCTRCSLRAEHLYPQDAAELVCIKQNIILDELNQKLTFTHPTKGDVDLLTDNRLQAIGCESLLEVRLDHDGTRKDYNDEYNRYIVIGAFKKL